MQQTVDEEQRNEKYEIEVVSKNILLGEQQQLAKEVVRTEVSTKRSWLLDPVTGGGRAGLRKATSRLTV